MRIFILGIMLIMLNACGQDNDASTHLTCQAARDACLKLGSMPGRTCVQCQENNSDLYKPIQCSGSTGFCNCVNVQTGKAYGQSIRGKPECN